MATFTGTTLKALGAPSLVLHNSPCRCCSLPATSQLTVWTSLHYSTVFSESYVHIYIYIYYINLRGTSSICPQIIQRHPSKNASIKKLNQNLSLHHPFTIPSLDAGHQHLTEAASLAYLGPNREWLSTVHLGFGHQEMLMIHKGILPKVSEN